MYDWPPLFWLEQTQSTTLPSQCCHSSYLHTCDDTPDLKGAPPASVATQLVAQAPLLVTTTMKTVARRPKVLDVKACTVARRLWF